MVRKLRAKFKLIRKVQKSPLTFDTLFEVCRLIALNEPLENEQLFKYTNTTSVCHVLTMGGDVSTYSTEPKLKIELSIFQYRELTDFNIRVNITNRIGDRSSTHTILFKNEISERGMYDNLDMTFNKENLENLISVIRLSLVNTIYNMKRWY